MLTVYGTEMVVERENFTWFDEEAIVFADAGVDVVNASVMRSDERGMSGSDKIFDAEFLEIFGNFDRRFIFHHWNIDRREVVIESIVDIF